MTITKTLFCGIFIFFFLEIRSETTTGENNLNTGVIEQPNTTQQNHGVRSELTVKTPADVTLPHNAPSSTVFDSKTVTTSSSADQTTADKTTADKTRIASEKPFANSVSGTEKPTHRETSSITTTVVNITSASTTEVKSPEEKSTVSPTSEQKLFNLLPKNTTFTTPTNTAELTTGFLPILNKSTKITTTATTTVSNLASVSPKTEPQFSENMTGFPATQKTSALTTSLTTTTNKSAIINTTTSKETLSTMSTALPENISASTTSAITTSHNQTIQNITSKVINQSSSTTEVPRTNATNGTALVNRIKTTQISRNISATTEALPKHQSTTATNIPTTVFSNISTTNVTTNATHGVWIPAFTKTLPTTKPHSTEESTQKTQPCSTVGVVKQCLIVIASLAVVATIFIISTIILCTKLSSRKYKLRRQQQGTEMRCISSLLNERSTPHHRYTRQRSPVPNGVLVIHPCGDSDDEIGDNLTLSSFLPDNDRYV